jgi:hypothetical protein
MRDVTQALKEQAPNLYKEIKNPSNPSGCPDIEKHGFVVYMFEENWTPDAMYLAYCACMPPIPHGKVIAYGGDESLKLDRKKAQALPWKTKMVRNRVKVAD